MLSLFTPFGSTVKVKGNPKIASIGHSVHGNPKVRYDTGFSIAFLHKYMSILLPHFITPFGVAVRGKAKLRILELVSPYSEKPTVRHVSDLTLVLLHKRITICYPLFTHFGVAVRGKAKLEMLAFVIPYSENTIR